MGHHRGEPTTHNSAAESDNPELSKGSDTFNKIGKHICSNLIFNLISNECDQYTATLPACQSIQATFNPAVT